MKSQACSAKVSSNAWTVAHPVALSRQPEFIELSHLLADIRLSRRKPEQGELHRVSCLADSLNEKGFSDDEIRRTFSEFLRSGRLAS